jgi:hypothetical protein
VQPHPTAAAVQIKYTTPGIADTTFAYPSVHIIKFDAANARGTHTPGLAARAFSYSLTNNIGKLLTGNGDGSFTIPSSPTIPAGGAAKLFAGDVNNDGFDDLAVIPVLKTASVTITVNTAGGTQTVYSLPNTQGFTDGVMVDINGDGKLDIAAVAAGNGVWYSLQASGGGFGAWTSAAFIGSNSYPSHIVAGDLNNVRGLLVSMGLLSWLGGSPRGHAVWGKVWIQSKDDAWLRWLWRWWGIVLAPRRRCHPPGSAVASCCVPHAPYCHLFVNLDFPHAQDGLPDLIVQDRQWVEASICLWLQPFAYGAAALLLPVA